MWKDITKPKKSAAPKFDLDAALKQSSGEVSTETAPVTEQKKTNEFDIDSALKESLKKKDTNVSESGSTPSTSNSEAPSTSSENNLNPEGASIFDNAIINPSLNKNPVITTPDGGELKITNPTPLDNSIEGLRDIQARVSKKIATPQDVQTLADATGKSVDATTAYLTKGQLAGGSVENNEKVQQTQNQLADFIDRYNKNYGTQFDPKEVMASSKSLNDFLQLSKSTALQTSKNVDESQPLSQEDIGKMSVLFGMQPVIDKMLDQIVNKTIDEDQQAGLPKEETINKIAKTLNPKAYQANIAASNANNSDNVGNNGFAAIVSLLRDNKSEDELLNFQKGIAELKYNQGLKQNAIDKISQGVVSGDKNLVSEGQQDLTKVDDNVIDKYPALQKQQIAKAVNDQIAKESGVVEGSDTQDGGRMERVFGASTQDRLDAMQKLGFLDNPKTKDIALSMAGNSTYFANNSILGGAIPSLLQPFADLGMSVGDITGVRNNKDLITDKLKDEIFQKDFSQNNPDDPNVLHLKNDVRISRNIVNTTANLAGMMAIASATEGVAGEAGVSVSAGQKLGAYTSFGLPSFDASLKDSKSFIDSEPAQYLYATINSIANAEGGRLLDLGKITRIPGVSEDFATLAKGLSDNSISKSAAKELLENGTDKYVDFAIKYGKNVTKGAATMAYFSTANNIIKMAFGDPATTKEDVIMQAGHAFLDGVLGMSVLGGFGAAADMRNEKNTSYKGTIYNMAVNNDAAKDVLDLGFKNGEYTKPEYDQKVQILNTSIAAKNALDATEQETGVGLSQDQKAVYVANKTAQAVFKNKAEQEGITEDAKKKYLSQADKLSEQSAQVLDGLKFNSTLEPLYDLYNAEKEYNTAKENFNPADKASDDALLAAKSNYDKLYSDYLRDKSDSPVNISSQSKTSQNEGSQENNSVQENGQASGEKNDGKGLSPEKGQNDVNDKGVVTDEETTPLIQAYRDKTGVTKEAVSDEDLLKGISQQAQNLGTNPETGKIEEQSINNPNAYKDTVGQAGQELVDIATKLFPKEETKATVVGDNKKPSLEKLLKVGDNFNFGETKGAKIENIKKRGDVLSIYTDNGLFTVKDGSEVERIVLEQNGFLEPKTNKEVIPEAKTKNENTNGSSQQEIVKINEQRNSEIDKIGKPEIKFEKVNVEDLVKSKDPIGNKKKYKEIIKRYKVLEDLVNCL